MNLKVGDSVFFPAKAPFSVGQVYEVWPDEERESKSEVRVEFPAADEDYGERMVTLLALGDLTEEGDGVWRAAIAPRPYPPEPIYLPVDFDWASLERSNRLDAQYITGIQYAQPAGKSGRLRRKVIIPRSLLRDQEAKSPIIFLVWDGIKLVETGTVPVEELPDFTGRSLEWLRREEEIYRPQEEVISAE